MVAVRCIMVCAMLAAAGALTLDFARADPAGDCEDVAAPAPPFATPAQLKHSKIGDWPRAVEACEAAVRANPADPRLNFLLGRAYDLTKAYLAAARA